MMQPSIPRSIHGGLLLFGLIACAALAAHAAGQRVPPGIAGLLPKSAALKGGDWSVFQTEFGKTFGGGMLAQFPGLPLTCDSTVGPELRVTIKGDTAWEAPPMLDMALAQQDAEIRQVRGSLPSSVATMLKTNSGVQSLGTLRDEQLPSGRLLYIEFKENCARHPNGAGTVLRGFARKGAAQISISVTLTRPAAETRALAIEMLERFQRLDVAALTR